MLERIEEILGAEKDDFMALNKYIYENPELGNEEYKSSRAHMDLLASHGFDIEEGYLGLETAFRACYDSGQAGPSLAFLAEYDALPDIGHGCGHNILGTVSTASAIVLSKLLHSLGGRVLVLGCPAEETNGAKVVMAQAGSFDDIDVAMLVHPHSHYMRGGSSSAMEALEMKFLGKTSHAAASPERGINALDACIQTFNAINALREHILPDARIHGIISQGGRAANIIPDLAIAEFYIRASRKEYLKELVEKVKNCGRAGALATGAQLEFRNYEYSNDNLITNRRLEDLFAQKLSLLGGPDLAPNEDSSGSTDVGNVSQVCPTIQPYFSICEDPAQAPSHTVEFREASLTDYALENMLLTIKALCLTSVDLLENKELFQAVVQEFKNRT